MLLCRNLINEAVIETNNKINVEKWSVAVIRDSFLFKKISQDAHFPRTNSEEKDHKEASLIKCVKCRDHFIERFVYDNL